MADLDLAGWCARRLAESRVAREPQMLAAGVYRPPVERVNHVARHEARNAANRSISPL